MSATAARINEYVSIYISILCLLLLLLQLQSQSNAVLFVCFFRSSTVFYQQQQCQHVLYQPICHHDVLSPSKYNMNITATITTGTRSDNGNGNGNREMQTTQQRIADRDQQQSFSIVNNIDTSSIKSLANTSFPPSATGTPQQQLQLQLQRNPTMVAMEIVTRR